MSIHPALSQLSLTMCPGIDTTDNVTSIDHHEQDLNKPGMFQTFQSWALRNYGDTGKTKTVTKRKYERIIKILKGEEQSTAENSKFRFWVKAKGFRIGCDIDLIDRKDDHQLFVPTRVPSECGPVESEKELKKVAIVEDFFDIIYNVHVDMDGRAGKHAGQKRTYRAIAETYAFLPREAVTRFLMSCSDCQKRMHLTTEMLNNNNTKCMTPTPEDPPDIDFGLPITQTYLNHMRSASFRDKECLKDDDSISSEDSEMSGDRSVSPQSGHGDKPIINGQKTGTNESIRSPVNMATSAKCARLDEDVTLEKLSMTAVVDHSETASVSPVKDESSCERLLSDRSERKRRASDELSLDSSTKASDSGNLDELQTVKDEDDDEENDDEDKVLPGQNIDPERLKSFNMFVRLFVDENLDRMVPISKQPKDKIQAILEACDRQFPEFHERSRKRIRTYLKSCRRMRRSKESNGWEPLRPTPPHLTSAAAEGILAQACENESSNAKRMRMGLDPLPASVMQGRGNTSSSSSGQSAPAPQSVPPASTTPTQPAAPERQPAPQPPPPAPPQPTIPKAHTPNQPATVDRSVAPASDFLRHTPAFRPPHDFHPPFFANGNGLFRPSFPPGYQPPAHHHPQILQHQSLQHTQVQNGPTDLSLKKQSAKSQLSPSEVVTIKQLIAGYRESAAFLYRSADELEQLLLQQN